ncbi:MAG TPA: hypothetical protein VLF68_02280 [Candidatus Saccharimonadales bacterium]|nr:hypothetical protein [Candidatus Saccharimonadales bacterium]
MNVIEAGKEKLRFAETRTSVQQMLSDAISKNGDLLRDQGIRAAIDFREYRLSQGKKYLSFTGHESETSVKDQLTSAVINDPQLISDAGIRQEVLGAPINSYCSRLENAGLSVLDISKNVGEHIASDVDPAKTVLFVATQTGTEANLVRTVRRIANQPKRRRVA